MVAVGAVRENERKLHAENDEKRLRREIGPSAPARDKANNVPHAPVSSAALRSRGACAPAP